MRNQSQILIVEDEPAIAQLLLMLMGDKGYLAHAVGSGQEALSYVSQDTDLILLDILLPDCEGIELCHRFKNQIQTRNIPIIVISGSTKNNDKIESFHEGADDFITKPFEPDELFARMEAVLRRSHSNRHQEIILAQVEQEHELRQIINEQKVIPFFQPIYFLNQMNLFGLEVLCRPQVNGSLSNPEDLFKAAMRHGLYYELEMVMWRKAIMVAKKSGYENLFLNCNPSLIESGHFNSVKDLFNDYAMPVGNIFLEITERSAISQYDLFIDYLLDYRRQGFKIAIDDVGAGYSSLDIIVKTKPEVVKIDRQIVSGLSHDSFKRSIIKLIVAFCQEHGIICIAEGIETKQDLAMLLDLGVEAGQGYLLFKPVGQIDLKAMRAVEV